MLTDKERDKKLALMQKWFRHYEASKKIGQFRWFYRYHGYYLTEKRLLLLDEFARIMVDKALDNRAVLAKLDEIVDAYLATFQEKP